MIPGQAIRLGTQGLNWENRIEVGLTGIGALILGAAYSLAFQRTGVSLIASSILGGSLMLAELATLYTIHQLRERHIISPQNAIILSGLTYLSSKVGIIALLCFAHITALPAGLLVIGYLSLRTLQSVNQALQQQKLTEEYRPIFH